MIIKKGTKLYSILYNKCPRCQEGTFFTESNPYNLSMFDKMEKRCSACNQSFEPETGFYYGAMYVSYGINVLLFVVFWILSSYIFAEETSTWKLFVFIITPSLLLVPVTYRLARLIWINLFVSKKN